MLASHLTPLSLSIGDVDSYDMLFYAHYLRFCERAANACLPPGRAYAVLARADLVKYSSSVRWNDSVEIRSTLVPTAPGSTEDGDQHILLHEWVCTGKVVHTALATYQIHGGGSFVGAAVPVGTDERRIRALQRSALELFSPTYYARELREVWPDMCGTGGSLGLPCILDLMERQRTELIGGQSELERLKQSEGIMIVVYTMQQLRLHGAPVAPRDTIEVSPRPLPIATHRAAIPCQ